MNCEHWVLRACHPHQPFLNDSVAASFWNGLQRGFPHALAAVLMPNHLHLLVPVAKSSVTRAKLNQLAGAVSKIVSIAELWQPIPPPSPIPDRHHLRRQLRYVALNPCRKRLCSDPLAWLWSTYRDLFGAVPQPWVTEQRLAHALGGSSYENACESSSAFIQRFHAYVSSDPSVHVTGTPRPVTAPATSWPRHSLQDILFASAAALRVSPTTVRDRASLLRTLFVTLALRQGWRDKYALTQVCKISRRGLDKLLNGISRSPAPDSTLRAASLCLGDVRLRSQVRDSFHDDIAPEHG